MRYFDMTDIYLIETMGMNEYQMRMEAAQLMQLDKRALNAELAWQRQVVQSTRGEKHPRPVFDSYDKFFGNDYKQAENRIKRTFNTGEYVVQKSKEDAILERQQRLNEIRGKEELNG
ncbi:hypothetical protein [Weissella minor]|nr:hypothetical protein [Weissella minor]